MHKLMLVAAIPGMFVGATLASRAGTDAANDVSSSSSSLTSTESQMYEFVAPPSTSADVVYRVNRYSGEVGSCVFSVKGPTIGSTLCFPAGEGAGAQRLGDYGLVASNSATANGLFRVNRQSGEMSVCYVLNERVVCTAPQR